MSLPSSTPVSNPYADEGDETDGFTVRVYDKHLDYQGLLGGYESLTCVVRHNAISTAEVVVRADHPRVPQLLAAGARMVITYNHQMLMSGRMESRGASANAGTPVVTFNLVDDFQFFSLILGWPAPDRDIDEQSHGVDGDGVDPSEPAYQKAYWRSAGLASNVVKYIVHHNVDRLGLNLAFYGTSDDLGSWIHVRSRMDTLADVLVAKVDRAGLGMRIGGYGTDHNLNFRFYVPTVRDKVLSADSGVLVDWSWTQAEPVVTRVVIGGAGEHTDREYQTFTHDYREAFIGTLKEVFVDARDIGSDYEAALKDVKDKLAEHTRAFKAAEVQRLIRQKSRVASSQAEQAVTDAEWRRDHATNPSAEYTEAVAQVTRLTDAAVDADAVYVEDSTEYASLSSDEVTAWAAYNDALALRDALKASTDEEYAEKAADVFHEGGTQYGLSLTLAETDSFRYGDTFLVGDTVTVALPGSVTITDVVREVTISNTVEQGIVVSPVVGTQDTMANPNRVLVGTIKRLMMAARKLQTSR